MDDKHFSQPNRADDAEVPPSPRTRKPLEGATPNEPESSRTAPRPRKRARRDPPQLLTHDQQELLLDELERGLSASRACRKLNLLPSDFVHTLRQDPVFAGLCEIAQKWLTGDVEMAAYASAMKGIATAQALYLKHHPPSAGNNALHDDNFEDYTEAELVELIKLFGGTILPEFENDLT